MRRAHATVRTLQCVQSACALSFSCYMLHIMIHCNWSVQDMQPAIVKLLKSYDKLIIYELCSNGHLYDNCYEIRSGS